MTPHSRTFAFRGTAVGVTSTDRSTLDWLEEFLCPWFETSAAAADVSVRFTVDDAAFRALEQDLGSSPGRQAPCFALDTRVVSFPAWERGGRLVLLDRADGAYLVVEGRQVEVVTRDGARRARIALMRVLREIACQDQRRRNGIELHASAFSVGGAAVVLAGPKLAGKTTLLAWALGDPDARFVANDRLFAYLDGVGGREPVALGVPTIVSVRGGTLERFPSLACGVPPDGYASRMTLRELDEALPARDSTAPPDLAALSPAQFMRLLRTAAARVVPIAAVVFPEVVDRDTSRLERLAGPEALTRFEGSLYGRGAESARTVLGDLLDTRGPTRPLGERLEELAGRVPCYHYRHGRDAYVEPLRSSPLARLVRGS